MERKSKKKKWISPRHKFVRDFVCLFLKPYSIIKYGVKVEHLSTHSLRKTFGRKVVESAGENSEMALIKLSELFNHTSPQITRRYLGLRQEELMEVYNSLEF